MSQLYEVVYDAAHKITMTQEQVQGFLKELASGKEVVEFNGNFLTKFFRVIVQKETNEGRLHDGTKVMRIHGEWRSVYSPEARLDPMYYPEIAEDKVMSEMEWQEKRKLLTAPRYETQQLEFTKVPQDRDDGV